MTKIQGFRIRNFRVLKDITLGKLWNTQKADPLTSMSAVIGKNGVGKSTLFDAFGFLADCLKIGVEEACDADRRHYINPPGPPPALLFHRGGEQASFLRLPVVEP